MPAELASVLLGIEMHFVREPCVLRIGLQSLTQFDIRADYSFACRSRSELVMTETELKLIAAAARIGLSKIPKNG